MVINTHVTELFFSRQFVCQSRFTHVKTYTTYSMMQRFLIKLQANWLQVADQANSTSICHYDSVNFGL